jgi:hypothetical protein
MDIAFDTTDAPSPGWLSDSLAFGGGLVLLGQPLGFELAQREQLRGSALARRPAAEAPLVVVPLKRSAGR